ncbi:Putative 115 kDa protein in type-1 retrotransposable element R1DM [Eumeta japonica]|uniref:115 kDa protein in type-1 retrotransposable element R1DM n=1 Tax=Eumeta variegata TaxID=151549 RepID=A0A4C1SSM4_EUMVA|nr:Putative 115 kDa protein in type-1 retrotransposable element R1DM [Eumeta japonica]
MRTLRSNASETWVPSRREYVIGEYVKAKEAIRKGSGGGTDCKLEAVLLCIGRENLPTFSGAEVKKAHKAFHPRKAPGIDGFISDICQAAIFQDLGLFPTIVNKCLELGHFPWTWKVAAIKVIPKLGKDDYACLKSYRPIGLFPVLHKTRGKDDSQALPMALDAEAAGGAVWFQDAARDGQRPL